jgi:uncharacterized membrane protein
MITPASVAKHPIHPMLIVFPIGLWIFSLIADIVYLSGGPPIWASVAYYDIIAGVVGAVLAAIPGFVDLFSLQPSRAKSLGVIHMTLNLIIIALFAISFGLRTSTTINYVTPFVLSIIGVALLLVSGWLGVQMVHVHGISVAMPPSTEEKPEEKKAEPARVDIRP